MGQRRGKTRVVVAGGGVAGLETVLALGELAPGLVDIELVSPEHHFWYRPLSVVEPFDAGRALHFDLPDLMDSRGAMFTHGEIAEVDPDARILRTTDGLEIPYDALVIACGARPRTTLAGALTFRGPADTGAFRDLLRELREGLVNSVAFALPGKTSWPLPLYELALLTATYLERQGIRSVELSLVTHEDAPLMLFGGEATEALTRLLGTKQIAVLPGRYAKNFEAGVLTLVPQEELRVDRVVALPELEGPGIAGLPSDEHGFVLTDSLCRVTGLDGVYAAGDATAFPVKQGGIAAQQADVAAEAIAAAAGADVTPHAFQPVLRGLLLTGEASAYLRAELGGGHGQTAVVSGDALWWPPAKIVGRYLAPFLAGRSEIEPEPPPVGSNVLQVDIAL
jgi:sulfide:quinone oxidoreductase